MSASAPTLDGRGAERRLDLCTFCPNLCLDVCPVSRATGNSAWSPWGKMSLLTWVRRREIRADDDVVDALWRCVGCLACTSLCDHDQPVSDMLFEARGLYAGGDGAHHGTARELSEDAARERLRELVPAAYHEEHALVSYLPGLGLLAHRPEAVTATFRVFESLGVDEVAITKLSPLDDGSHAREQGETERALAQGKSLSQAASRYKEVLVHDAHALRQLKTWLPQQELFATARVRSLAEGIDERIGRQHCAAVETLDALEAETRRVVWHDACLHARGGAPNESAAARRLYARAAKAEPLEMVHNGEDAWCCGRGASFSRTHPETASAITELALDEARAQDAELIVSSCPGAAASFAAKGLPAMDIIEYLDERLHGPAPQPQKSSVRRRKARKPRAQKT